MVFRGCVLALAACLSASPVLSADPILIDRKGRQMDAAAAPARYLVDLPPGPTELSFDADVQRVVENELTKAILLDQAIGGYALVLDVRSGEIVAMASVGPIDALENGLPFNRVSQGIYEQSSIAKTITAAMALDAGKVTLSTRLDARKALQYGKWSIGDYEPARRRLTVEEAHLHASNIGAARMALMFKPQEQKTFHARLGLTEKVTVEHLPTGGPIVPEKWDTLKSMTISFGHGAAWTPLQTAAAIGTLVNGGTAIRPTVLKQSRPVTGPRVISEDTSAEIRHLLRQDVRRGSGQMAGSEGVRIGGKAATAEKALNGRYVSDRVLASFVAITPIDAPRFVIMTMLDEPKPINRRPTGGETAALVIASILSKAPATLTSGLEASTPIILDERAALGKDGNALNLSVNRVSMTSDGN